MSGAVLTLLAVCAAWSWKVVQRNAPGAISAMAVTVMPVKVRLRFISPATGSATWLPFSVSLSKFTPAGTSGALDSSAALRSGEDHRDVRFPRCQSRVNGLLRLFTANLLYLGERPA